MNSTNEQNNRQTERNSKDAKKDDSTGGEFICLIQLLFPCQLYEYH